MEWYDSEWTRQVFASQEMQTVSSLNDSIVRALAAEAKCDALREALA